MTPSVARRISLDEPSQDAADRPYPSRFGRGRSAGWCGKWRQRLPESKDGFVEFLKQNKKWWLTPILFSILALALLALLGEGASTPLIYTLF